MTRTLTILVAIAAFVLCWSSGYMAARFTENFFEPFNLLLVRYIGTSLLLAAIVAYVYGTTAAQAIRSENIPLQVLLGVLYHVVYIGCVFYAVKMGLSAGITAVILATQPLATLLLESAASFRWPTARILFGTAVCFVGAILIVDYGRDNGAVINFAAIAVALLGVAAISIATILHASKVKNLRLWPSLLIQFITGTLCIVVLLLFGFEDIDIRMTYESALFVTFLILVTTLGSYMLIGWLLKNIPTSLYANIFYLVPPTVMIAEYIYYGEQISTTQVLGVIVILLGIFIGFSKLKLPYRLNVRNRV